MADKSAQLVLDALTRAVAEPAGQPLFTSKNTPGLFATTGPAKLAAQRCKDEDLLRVVRTETRGKNALEFCTLTDKGLTFLLGQTSPRQVLEDLVRAVEARQQQLNQVHNATREVATSLAALRALAEKVIYQSTPATTPNEVWQKFHTNGDRPAGSSCETTILALLEEWQASGASEDFPLPELFRKTGQKVPGLTIGHFHDTLRRLHDRAQIYLHPWTGPLYALSEPPAALLVGHEIAYYASIRR
jgi:hypothetical protein